MKVFAQYGFKKCGHMGQVQILIYDNWDTFKLFTYLKPIGEKYECDICKEMRIIKFIKVWDGTDPQPESLYPETKKFDE